jgi:Tfp pilus assembly protein PilF
LRRALKSLSEVVSAANHYEAAVAYHRVGVNDLAEEHLTEALRLEPALAAAHDLRARIWRDWGFPEVALTNAHRAVFYSAGEAASSNTLGTVLLALGQPREALMAFERSIESDPRAFYAQDNARSLRAKQDQGRRLLPSRRLPNIVTSAMPCSPSRLGLRD